MKLSVVFCMLLLALSVSATTRSQYQFDSSEKERVFKTLLQDLRCLVCQNQNLYDSNASLAVDLKKKIYDSLQKNQSEDEIKTYLVKRYGDFILFKPPVKESTLILWFFPFVMLVIGVLVMITFIRRNREDA